MKSQRSTSCTCFASLVSSSSLYTKPIMHSAAVSGRSMHGIVEYLCAAVLPKLQQSIMAGASFVTERLLTCQISMLRDLVALRFPMSIADKVCSNPNTATVSSRPHRARFLSSSAKDGRFESSHFAIGF